MPGLNISYLCLCCGVFVPLFVFRVSALTVTAQTATGDKYHDIFFSQGNYVRFMYRQRYSGTFACLRIQFCTTQRNQTENKCVSTQRFFILQIFALGDITFGTLSISGSCRRHCFSLSHIKMEQNQTLFILLFV